MSSSSSRRSVNGLYAACLFLVLLLPAAASAGPPRDEGDDSAARQDDGRSDRPLAGPRAKPRHGMRHPDEMDRDSGDRPWWERRWGMRRGDGPLPREMTDRVMETLEQKLPEVHDRLSKLRDASPEHFDMALRKMVPIIMDYRRLREDNPEAAESIIEEFRIEQQLRDMSRRYKLAKESGDAAAQSQILAEIEQAVGRQFDLRAMRRAARLEQFTRRLQLQQQRLETEKQAHADELARRDEIVRKNVEDIQSGKLRESFGRDGGPDKSGPHRWRRGGFKGDSPPDGADRPHPRKPGDRPPPPDGDDMPPEPDDE